MAAKVLKKTDTFSKQTLKLNIKVTSDTDNNKSQHFFGFVFVTDHDS